MGRWGLSPPRADSAKSFDDGSERAAFMAEGAGSTFRAFHPEHEAQRLAWGRVINLWHKEHCERAPPHLCAGCRGIRRDSARACEGSTVTKSILHMTFGGAPIPRIREDRLTAEGSPFDVWRAVNECLGGDYEVMVRRRWAIWHKQL